MTYTAEFFVRRRAQALASATFILELMWERLHPQSVLDAGCATGTWLAEAKRKGAHRVRGIDGPWVPREHLEIGDSEFLEHDLGQSVPCRLGRFDLVLCIEVAEHLAPEASDQFVDFLTSHSDTVLFSAAIPGQGGTGHVNEQLQSYWHGKFLKRGFECFDVIRPVVWDVPDINVIYKQNMLLYVRGGSISLERLTAGEPLPRGISVPYDLDRVHPDLYTMRLRSAKRGVCNKIADALAAVRRRLSQG